MSLQHKTEDNVELVTLPKQLLMADAPRAKSDLLRIANKQQPRVIMDMSQLEYIDSSGLAVLVSCLQKTRRNSGELCLFGVRDTVRVLLDLTRLNDVLPIADEKDAAIERVVS